MIFRESGGDSCVVSDSLFADFVATTGGSISINHSRVLFESKSSTYFRCAATGSGYYNRASISGGAIAFFGNATLFEKSCFRECRGPMIGAAVYARSRVGSNYHFLNSYSMNRDGDGPLTSDGDQYITLKENKFTHSVARKNAAIAINSPSTDDSITNNNFVNLQNNETFFGQIIKPPLIDVI